MIGVDQIEFSDDGTALVVFWPNEDDEQLAVYRVADRPCDTCDGSGEQDWIIDNGGRPGNYPTPCPDCFGSGRLCFEIEVEGEWEPRMTEDRTLIVSVQPGMVEQQDDGTWRVKLAVHA